MNALTEALPESHVTADFLIVLTAHDANGKEQSVVLNHLRVRVDEVFATKLDEMMVAVPTPRPKAIKRQKAA